MQTVIESMTPAELASYERAMGARIVESGGVFWRRVRPLFYRPLIPFEVLDPAAVRPPLAARWGAWQYAVGDPGRANGSIACLMFQNAADYSLESMDKKRRWEVRRAQHEFRVRPLTEVHELLRAHPVFAEFQQRTGYHYRADRVRPDRYRAWAEKVFEHPKVRVLGAFDSSGIQAVGIVQRVADALLYATFFATDAALRKQVASLMLHVVRELAAATSGVHRVHAGLRKQGADASVDQFYLLRGAEVVTLPAFCRIHPLLAWGLERFRPDLKKRLLGEPWSASAGTVARVANVISQGINP
ncbi:hypothetical protein [Limisphaera sp. VF-2]|uniref:hypothetical protein n=1 Tax=Limisphaera sp. VF-2 TaxID=3400418 RepID=UPI003C2523EF